jgi:hypothetical protein
MTGGRRGSGSAAAVVGRRVAAAPAVTWHRLRLRPGRTLLVSAGVAVAVAFLVGAAGGSVLSEDLALRHALSAQPPAERVVRVSWSGLVAHGGYRAINRTARRNLGTLTNEPMTATLELADVQLGGGLVKLGAADSLRGVVDLRSGRLPTTCDNRRCEVVQIGGGRVSRIDDDGVHLVVVGRGTLASLIPFGEGGLTTQPTGAGERPEPVLLTSGVRSLQGLTPLSELNRNFTWSAPLAPASVHVWDVDGFLRAEGTVESRLAVASGLYSLSAPDDALSSAQSQSVTASRRVLLVGGAAALLLLAFAGVTAGALRRDARAELRRLSTRGATRGQERSFVLSEAIAAVIPGALAGVALGAVAVALLARRSGVTIGEALRHGLVTPSALALAVLGTIGAVIAVVLALRAPDPRPIRGIRPVDMAALGAVVALALLLARAEGEAGSLGTGPALSLAAIPLLSSFAFCVLLGRLLQPVIRLSLRAARSGPSTLLLALLTLHRSPGRTAGIVGFLAVSIGLAMFAVSYRSTLSASSAERAAYQVPLDYTLDSGASLVQPQQLASLARYRELAPGVGAWPILQQVAETPGTGTTPETPTVLGVPAAAFPLLHGWRGDFSAYGPATLGRLLRPAGPVELAGATIPAGARSLSFPARVVGADLQLVLVVQQRGGGADQLLPPLATPSSRVLTVLVPAADRGGKIVALQLQLPSAVERSEAHQEAEGHNETSGFGGTLRLGPIRAVMGGGSIPVSSFAGWLGLGGVTPHRGANGLGVKYLIDTSEQAMLRPRQPFDARRLPVIASPDVAAGAGPGGAIELNFGDEVVPARLVAVARRFPTTQEAGESFVVADEASLAAAIGANDLPSSVPGELWLSVPPASVATVGKELSEPPFDSLAVSSRAAIASGLRAEPLARGIVVSLSVAALAAIGLALVGLALVTIGFVRDEGDALFDLETQGVGPRALRACVRWRALGLAGIGIAGGIVLGVAMVVLTERLLALDATLTLPDPPLERVIPWLTIVAGACVFALAAAALIELVLRVGHADGSAGRGVTGESWAG